MAVQFYKYTKIYWIVPLKQVNFMVYNSYLDKAVFKKRIFRIWQTD